MWIYGFDIDGIILMQNGVWDAVVAKKKLPNDTGSSHFPVLNWSNLG